MNPIRPTLFFVAFLSLLFGGIYPLLSTGLIQAIFPNEAQGSLIHGKDGKLLGSHLIGQNFSEAKYFWGRLSATSPYAYNAASSSGSNFGPNNPALIAAGKGRVDALHAADADNRDAVPVDLATASSSGLDPEISVDAAQYQVGRVAKARGMTHEALQTLVQAHTRPRQFGILGEPGVNVLELNLALDGKL